VGQLVWRGTQAEANRLLAAVEANCQCVYEASGTRTTTCKPHEMMTLDQKILDHLLFIYRERECLMRREWDVEPTQE